MRPFSKPSIGRFLTAFAAAAIAFLFAVTAPARSETPEAEALAPVTGSMPAEGAPPVEEAQPPVEQPPVEEAQVPPTAAVPTPDPAADVSAAMTESPDDAVNAAVAAAAQPVSEVVKEVSRGGTAAEQVTGQVTETVNDAVSSAGNRRPQPILPEALKRRPGVEQLLQAGAPAHGSLSRGAPAAIEAQAPPTGIASAPGPGTSNKTPSLPASPPAGQPTQRPIAAADDLRLPPSHVTAPGPGGESHQLLAPGGSIGLLAAVAVTAASAHSSPGSGPVPGHPTDRAPLDGPQPFPDFSGEAIPAPGGSSFVPFAALLALLALVAAAILRRFREVPDLPAPALFVCALERPG